MTTTPDTPFQHVLIDGDSPRDPHCKAAGDLDGDGCPDLVAASAKEGGLYWYRYPEWSKHRIADGSFTTDMAVGDLDGDGHQDVVIPGDDGLMLYRNPRASGGDPSADAWEAVNLSPEGTRMHNVQLVDLDGDGKLDIVTRHQSGFGKMKGNGVYLWKQGEGLSFTRRVFPCPHGEGLKVADINGNGRPDVVIGGRWYENPGDVLAGEWTEHLYMTAEHFDRVWTNGDVVVQTGDLNGDGRCDIVISPAEGTGRLSWFEAPDRPADPDWTEHVIEEVLDHTHGLAVGDVTGDGRLDIVAAKMHQATAPQEVCLYRNQRTRGWDKQVVATTGSHNIALVDTGSDGRLDIYGANWNDSSPTGGAVELWVNQRPLQTEG